MGLASEMIINMSWYPVPPSAHTVGSVLTKLCFSWLIFMTSLSGRDNTCGKTKHELGFSKVYLHKEGQNTKIETTTDVFILNQLRKEFCMVLEVRRMCYPDIELELVMSSSGKE